MSVYREAKGSIVLKAVIVLLVAVLVYVIYEPYQIREQENTYRRESRLRMLNIRAAQLQYINRFFRYNTSLDSLVQFVHDSLIAKNTGMEMFVPLSHGAFTPESLLHSPKSLRPYMLSVNDTSRIKKYLLECPDGYGSIGSVDDDMRVNKASWED
jgi:hypothetical protein